jgi:RimJ/RimL family protein N-acetyltransferase
MRTYETAKVKAATAQYAEEIVDFDPDEWLDDPKNIALININDDVALFENQALSHKAVCGHYFFFSRGKEAVKAAQAFLKEIFSYDIETIVGITPTDNKGALWMNRRLGFKEYGKMDTHVGPCRLVVLTKKEWEQSNNE